VSGKGLFAKLWDLSKELAAATQRHMDAADNLDNMLTGKYHKRNDENGANTQAIAYTMATGGKCEAKSSQVLCYGHSPGGDQPMTVGDVLFLPHGKSYYYKKNGFFDQEKDSRDFLTRVHGKNYAEKYGPDLLRHEAVHSEQWARFGSSVDYELAYTAQAAKSKVQYGNNYEGNSYEVEANLYWGGYKNAP
jgi:hypothetical protein